MVMTLEILKAMRDMDNDILFDRVIRRVNRVADTNGVKASHNKRVQVACQVIDDFRGALDHKIKRLEAE